MYFYQRTLLAVPFLAAVSSIVTLRQVNAVDVQVQDECPAFVERTDCVEITSYEQFRDIVQNERPEGELVLCPFDVQLSPEDKVTWIRTDLKLICSELNSCTLRGGKYQIKIHGDNEVMVQGFNFIGAKYSAFRVWRDSPKLQKVCHNNFESNKGGQKGTSVRLEGLKIFIGHSIFTDNHSDQQGAGLYTYQDACVYNSRFYSNSAQRGSSIFVDGGGTLAMKDSHFENNVALGSGGPAVYVNAGGSYLDGGGNTAIDNEGGQNCEGVLVKNDCELIFTTSDETNEVLGGEQEGGEDASTEAPTEVSTEDITDMPTSTPTEAAVPTSTPANGTNEPTEIPTFISDVTDEPTASPTLASEITDEPTAVLTLSPTQAATNPNQTQTSTGNSLSLTDETRLTWLSFVDNDHVTGALGKCEGDCNKDEDCADGLLCFRRAINGGWKNLVVPGCKGDSMRRVDYCYDPLDNSDSVIMRGEPNGTDAVGVDSIPGDEGEQEDDGFDGSNMTELSSEFTDSDEPTTAEPTSIADDDQPTMTPNISATTESPTVDSSSSPTFAPTSTPTDFPTNFPTDSPTETQRTKQNEFIDNTRSNPDGGYFNYDLQSSYGPSKWKNVKASKTEEYNYWKEFKDGIKEDLTKNYCGSSSQQSPINVVDTGSTCLEYHQIRDRPGDFLEDDIEVEKVIGQNKLRVVWPRRDGEEPDPPGADIPKGWGHIIDAVNADIVVPAEHTINGRHYVGEYRIYHMHDGGKGVAAITSLMEIHPLNRRNSHFQKLIDQFQFKFDEDMLKCQNKKRRERGLRALVGSKGENGVSSLRGKNRLVGKEKFPSYRTRKAKYERELARIQYDHDDPSDPYTSFGRWDPYDPSLIPSLWFYGYEGSLTEPPCTPFVSWRIMDKPMYLASSQLKQIKNLIFNHVDENCNPTSNQFQGKSARPIQKTKKENEVYRCTCKDFTSDKMRAQSGVYQCSDSTYEILHPENPGF